MRRAPLWLLSVALMSPLGAYGEPSGAPAPAAGAVRRIGFLGETFDPVLIDAFKSRLKELGYTEGRAFDIEYRSMKGRTEDLPRLSADLVRVKVDVIVAQSSSSVRAAQATTTSIPIVMVAVGSDPVQLGFVKSLGRPGGNVTGVYSLGSEIWPKRLQLIRQLVPRLSRVTVLWNPSNPGNVVAEREIRTECSQSGVLLTSLGATTEEELDHALAQLAREPPEALLYIWDNLLKRNARKIGAFAVRQHIPTMTGLREYVEGGALMSYGARVSEQYRRAADYVDKILKGANPADLPVELPVALDLVINRRTAKALGLTIPPELLLLASEVIE